MSNRLDPDQVQFSIGPNLGPNCLQRLTFDICKSCQQTTMAGKGLTQVAKFVNLFSLLFCCCCFLLFFSPSSCCLIFTVLL